MKIKENDKYYFIALGLYLAAKNLEISTIYYTVWWMPQFLKILRYMSYIMIISISIFLTRYNIKEIGRYILLMLIFLIVSKIAGSATILLGFMFIFAGKDISMKRVIKYVICIQSIFAVSVALGSLIGLIEDWTYSIAGRFRHSLGYGYPNTLPTIYFYIILAFCYLVEKRFKFWQFVVLQIGNYAIYSYTNTRTAFALTAVSLAVFWCITNQKRMLIPSRGSKLLYVHSIYTIAIFSILICYFYSPSNLFLEKLNAFVSNRISMGHNALMANKMTLFGQKIQWYGFGGVGYIIDELAGEYNYVDCSYIKILLDHGVVMLSLAILGYMRIATEELNKGNRFFCVALLFANLYAMIEPRYIETGLNPFVWCLSSLIRNKLSYDNKTEKS